MGFITVTNTFSNGTASDATAVNANFTDIINGTSDGTKNFNIFDLTAAGTSTLSGAVVLGTTSVNDMTLNGSLASHLLIKTTTTYDVGTTTKGLRAIYLGDAASAARCTKILGATISAGWTLTLPTSGGTSGYFLQTDGNGVTSWAGLGSTKIKTTTYQILNTDTAVLCDASSAAFTVTLPAASSSWTVNIIKTDTTSKVVTVACAGSDTLGSGTDTTAEISAKDIGAIFISNGTSKVYYISGV